MNMRSFTFDNYDTWHDWKLTLTAKDTTPPEPKTNYIQLDGMHGTLDLTEALTGSVAYNDRTVTASFWTSEGTAAERVDVFRRITAALHGRKVKIVEPDDLDHYFLGRVTVQPVSHNAVYSELDIKAVCDPWRYAVEESQRRVELTDADAAVDVVIVNNGTKILCPEFEVEVEGVVSLTCNGVSATVQTGAYKFPDLQLQPGANVIRMSGSGVVTVTYREAGL